MGTLVRLGSLAWDIRLGIIELGPWVRGAGILTQVEPLGGSWGNQAGRAATLLGEAGTEKEVSR